MNAARTEVPKRKFSMTDSEKAASSKKCCETTCIHENYKSSYNAMGDKGRHECRDCGFVWTVGCD